MTIKKIFTSPTHPLRSLLLLLILGFIWGTGYSIARLAMTHGVPPLGYSFWQSLGPAIVLMTILFFRRPTALSSTPLRFYLITGIMGIVIPNTTMYFAAPHLPASILAMVVNIVPIIAYPMALAMGLELFHWQRILGILVALAGLMLIILPSNGVSHQNVFWIIVSLITPFSFAIATLYIARYRPPGSDTLTLTTGMLITSSLLLTPLVLLSHHFYFFDFPFTLPDKVIILEVILSSAGYLLFFQLIKIAGPVYYSLVDTIVVLTGVFWGYVIFGEELTKWTAAAVCLIIMALLLVTQQQRSAALVKNE